MNKTITANISGFIFNIEEDAYKLLVNYLDVIKRFFNTTEGGDEIITDIEARIAELFSERLSESKQVILNSDVNEVIEIMGRPEQYNEASIDDDQPASSGSDTVEEEFQKPHSSRRVFRDPDERVLGGVCSGISYYFGWDPIWVRLAFVLIALLGGASIFVYIILWIVMPEARTTAEKLQMKKEPVTVENIRKHVNDSMDDIKDGAKKFSADAKDRVSENGKKVRGFFDQLGDGLGSAFGALGKLIAKFIGLILVIAGTGILIGSIVGLVAADHSMFASGLSWQEMETLFFVETGTLTLVFLAGILVLISVVVALFYGGLKLLLEFRTRIPGLGITLFLLFLLGAILASVSTWKGLRHLTHDSGIYEEYALDTIATDTLYVNVLEDPYFSGRICTRDDDFFDLIKFEENDIVIGSKVEVQFYETEDDSIFRVKVEFESNGVSNSDAVDRAESIDHEMYIEGNQLNISPYISIPKDQKYTGQQVTIRVYVPVGNYVQMDENIGRVYWRCNYGGKLVLMEEDGWEAIRE